MRPGASVKGDRADAHRGQGPSADPIAMYDVRGVGAPYETALPDVDAALHPLDRPVLVRCAGAGGQAAHWRIASTGFSSGPWRMERAELRSERPLPAPAESADGSGSISTAPKLEGELYGKVTAVLGESWRQVRFTGMHPRVGGLPARAFTRLPSDTTRRCHCSIWGFPPHPGYRRLPTSTMRCVGVR